MKENKKQKNGEYSPYPPSIQSLNHLRINNQKTIQMYEKNIFIFNS